MVERALADVARVLHRSRCRWFLFGAQALAVHGVLRATADVDLTVEASSATRLLAALEAAGFSMAEVGDRATFIAQTRVIPVMHEATGVPLDLVLAGPGLEQEILSRARLTRVGRSEVPVIEVNDLVVLKILAGRAKDLEDVQALLDSGNADLRTATVRGRLRVLQQLLDDSTLTVAFDALVKKRSRGQKP